MANPWSDVESAQAAAEGAGVEGFEVPAETELSVGPVFSVSYRCMEGIAQADIEYPASMATIRKGVDADGLAEGDISGDYNQYAHSWTQDINGMRVECSGNVEGRATKAIWSSGGYDYSIKALALGGEEDFGFNADDLTILVTGTK